MQVRVKQDCSQPIDRTGRNYMLREDRLVEWDRDGELPKYFVAVMDDADVEVVVVEAPPTAAPILHALDRDSQILEALNRMDHGDDDQWTTTGLPRVETVSCLLDELGFDPDVTRPEVNVAKPGFARD